MLFRVDDRDYRLARDAAELAVTGAGQDNTVMLAELAGARARVTGARATLEEARRKQRRLDNLHRSGAVSRQQWEEVQVAVEQARADLEAARAETKRLSTRLGDGDQDNLALARAMNQLETARLQLRRTEVKAPLAGWSPTGNCRWAITPGPGSRCSAWCPTSPPGWRRTSVKRACATPATAIAPRWCSTRCRAGCSRPAWAPGAGACARARARRTAPLPRWRTATAGCATPSAPGCGWCCWTRRRSGR
ncbi:hypothetical protein HML84_15295 [Alcanivorax sp. IO_7]|nr:hypothetical protein HML84_15295 [Alcanivorax sp. IO_7]